MQAIKLLVIRNSPIGNATTGSMFLDGKFECYTLEDVIRDKKVAGVTAIPKGTYDVTITMSPKYGKLMPLLNNVPNYSGVRIHSGNRAEDTEGCILVGSSVSAIGQNPILVGSRDAYSRLFEKLKKADKITIEIR